MPKTIGAISPTGASGPIPAWRREPPAPNSSPPLPSIWRRTIATGRPARLGIPPRLAQNAAGKAIRRRRSGGIDGTYFVQARRKARGAAAQVGAQSRQTRQGPGQTEGQACRPESRRAAQGSEIQLWQGAQVSEISDAQTEA